ncbi:SUMF1/EgtB/PvdO family nonheme iron enzyme [uncultured Lamprocystis sp.]|uniref:SUMF1/EgtB/PvdO family nonheme iron enzyme n=1 Tax=uncultured Lamprocystis sp. TaxID=543132 RepID=UPI0025FE8366|nr:SUMF1/EgtB/PvdO family nonheme iron enzyme [uncultured Lamprocystis sp.]
MIVHPIKVLAALVLAAQVNAAEAPAATPANPKPAEGDLTLPMPADTTMVFRPILVPGKSFWGGEERIIQLGDPDGGMFEGLQRVQINGSFPAPGDQGWFYYLGKYEVTKGQYVALMGLDALLAQSGNPKDKELAKLTGQGLQAALSEPLSGIGWPAVEAFVHAYNQWLFDSGHPERLKNLPRLEGVPGYLRLPTEVEWEYAARGGETAIRAGTFGDAIPVPAASLNNYAWHRDNAKAKVRPIGLREPNALGLYDLLGNVQELAAQHFLPEIWQGKPGGLVARGGSVLTPAKELRSAARAEVGIYRWDPDRQRMEEQRSLTTGIRLTIGSDVIVSPNYWQTLQTGYDAYKASIRANTPVGLTLEHPVAQGASAVGMAHAGIDELMSKNQALSTELTRIKSYIEQAEQKMDQAQQESARSLAQDALRNAANAGSFLFGATQMSARAKELEEMVKQLGDRFKDQLKLVKDKAAEKRQNASEQLDAYAKRVAELGEYGNTYVDQALAVLGKRDLSERERTAIVLLANHVAQYRATRRISREAWGNDFEKQYGTVSK